MLSRLLYAARVSLLASVSVGGRRTCGRAAAGMIAGYIGGKVDWLLIGIVDIILSVPPLILVFAVAGVLGASIKNAIVALGVYFTPMFIRLIRSEGAQPAFAAGGDRSARRARTGTSSSVTCCPTSPRR